MALRFSPKSPIETAFDFQVASPDRLQGLPVDEILRLEFQAGSSRVEVGDAWKVEGDPSDGVVEIEGECENARLLGASMKSGKLVVVGNAGDHVGARMSGGEIEVVGSAGDWLGAEMTGGRIKVRGSVGDDLGSAYPGSRLGMKDGTIFVEGSAGDNTGVKMRSGLIGVAGSAGEAAGRSMIAGSIFVIGSIGRLIGLGMKRGTIAVFGDAQKAIDAIPTTFVSSGSFKPHYLAIYLDFIAANGFELPRKLSGVSIERYNGDLAEQGRGEILISSSSD